MGFTAFSPSYEDFIELFAQGLQGLLPLAPEDVDLGVVGDGFQRDVGHALIDETVAEVALTSGSGRSG